LAKILFWFFADSYLALKSSGGHHENRFRSAGCQNNKAEFLLPQKRLDLIRQAMLGFIFICDAVFDIEASNRKLHLVL